MICCIRPRTQEEARRTWRCTSGIKPLPSPPPLCQKRCQSRSGWTSWRGMCEGGGLLALIWSLSFSDRLVWAWVRCQKILKSWGKWYSSLVLIPRERVYKFSYTVLCFPFETTYGTGQKSTLIRSSLKATRCSRAFLSLLAGRQDVNRRSASFSCLWPLFTPSVLSIARPAL